MHFIHFCKIQNVHFIQQQKIKSRSPVFTAAPNNNNNIYNSQPFGMHPSGSIVVATATTTITTIVTTNANMVNATTTTCNPYTSPSLDHHILKKSKELPKHFQRTSDDQCGRIWKSSTTANEPKFSLQLSSSSYHRRHSVSGINY